MSPVLSTPDSHRPNVPAWKRLGLKLKSAQQTSRPYEASMHVASGAARPKSKKREREAEDEEAPHNKNLGKSAKIHEPPLDTTPNCRPTQSPIASSPKRRKLVTFTPETKIEDGDSVKQLYSGWLAKHPGHAPNLRNSSTTLKTPNASQGSEPDDSTINEVLRQVEGAKKPIKRKKPQREKKKQQSLNSKRATSPVASSSPALLYLKQFHESKDTWKFNKIHQINLIKHVFNIDKVPSDYIDDFYFYISGLKGGARRQLRDSAIATMVKDREEAKEEAAENKDGITKKGEFEVALKTNMEALGALEPPAKIGYEERVLSDLSDLTMKKRMAKRMRAERILDELAQEALETAEGSNGGSKSVKESDDEGDRQKRIKLSDGSIKKLRRKRKQRTNAVYDESSSPESSSSSSSSESSSDESEAGQEPTEESTSSSSSSSSSTSSDDEEETDESESSGSESSGSETSSDEGEP